jgi:hypothetical protein
MIKLRYICFLLFIALGAAAISGQGFQLDWARTFRLDRAKTNQSWKIVLAADGVVVGGTSVSITGDLDYLVIKYGASGNQAWSYRHDSSPGANDGLRGLAIDPAGNVFATGTTDTVKLNSTGARVWTVPVKGRAVAATTNFVYVTGASDVDYSTSQLENNNLDGKENWMRTYDGLANRTDISSALALAPDGDVFVGGSETIGANLSLTVVMGIFRFGINGETRWHTTTELRPASTGAGLARNLALDKTGGVYIIGTVGSDTRIARVDSNGSRTLSTGTGAATTGSLIATPDRNFAYPGGGERAFLFKGLSEGGGAWVQHFGNPGAEGRDIAVDSSNGDLFVAGMDFQAATGYDIIVVKYTTDGSPAGSVLYDSPDHGNDIATAMVRDSLGNIYVTGYSTTPEGGTEFLTLKYSIGPRITAIPNGAMHLEFYALPGQQYTIHSTTNFLNWENLITTTADTNGLIQFDDGRTPTFPYRFYRGSSWP